ncbi:hypothetical protein Salat_2629600 [Sesamum alatum]|uniref:Uncharacterized protein n=1 Tax=Sesamum alatum TaxID=300844 RepID=A0AAE1XNN8_9LAMI|nr:hypothetical protein Salat_2629600 [Sesamum alatum]
MVRPAKTRFATAFLTLKRFHVQKGTLKKMMFTSEKWIKSRPLHGAGYFPNPEFFYTIPNVEKDKEVMQGLYGCTGKLVPSVELQDKIIDELPRALRRRYDARDTIDPILLDEIDESNEWLLGRLTLDDSDEENVNVFEDDDLTWGDVVQAARVDEDAYDFRSLPSQESKASSSKAIKKATTSSRSIEHRHLIDEEEEEEDEEEEHFNDIDEEEAHYTSDDDGEGNEDDLAELDD